MRSLDLAIILAVAFLDGLVLGSCLDARRVLKLRAQLAEAHATADELARQLAQVVGHDGAPKLRLVRKRDRSVTPRGAA